MSVVAAIYLRHGETYVAMAEKPYDDEAALQALIAQHPEVLADEDAGQGPLLLVRREAVVSDQDEGGGRWSLDHLYLDAQGVPTLVEAKRSSDTRGRREVVAQMLDYAANAKTSFSVERMAAWLEDAQTGGDTAAEALRGAFGVDDAEGFWETVSKNLETERFRLIFVSDVIGRELRKIIEFLNGQMTRTDVLAIEVKQYVDEHDQHQTIVPRVIGNTQAAQQVKRRSPRVDRDRLVAMVGERNAEAAAAAAALLDWADGHPDLTLRWGGNSGNMGLPGKPPLLRVWDEATLEVRLRSLQEIDESWSPDRIEQLVQRLEAIDGIRFPPGRDWPRTPLAPLADLQTRQSFIAIVDEVVRMLNPAA